jgi:hypothetical protein
MVGLDEMGASEIHDRTLQMESGLRHGGKRSLPRRKRKGTEELERQKMMSWKRKLFEKMRYSN